MNDISASFNFPSDFFWGMTPLDPDSQEQDLQSLLFRLQETGIQAILINVPWAKCEPLKGNFDEVYIESLRQKLIRIRNRNMMPVIIPDTFSTPAWLNLAHPAKEDKDSRYGAAFIRHLAGAAASFTNYIGIPCRSHRPILRAGSDALPAFFSETFTYIRSLAPDIKAGVILPEGFPDRQGGISTAVFRMQYGFLKDSGLDFLGIPAAEKSGDMIRAIFGTIRIPTIFISDGLKSLPPKEQAPLLADKLFAAWQTYQNGLPVIGYFSEADLTADDPVTEIFTNVCKSNSFRISTDMDWITEKWLRFLKD